MHLIAAVIRVSSLRWRGFYHNMSYNKAGPLPITKCAGAGHQSKPSEASRQRHLEPMLGSMFDHPLRWPDNSFCQILMPATIYIILNLLLFTS
jgi:hypothetical protein